MPSGICPRGGAGSNNHRRRVQKCSAKHRVAHLVGLQQPYNRTATTSSSSSSSSSSFSSAGLNALDDELLCHIFSNIENFPALSAVSKSWQSLCGSEQCFRSIVLRLEHSTARRGTTALQSYGVSTWKALWQAKHFHMRWRKSGSRLMVDFPAGVINSLTNDESALSQIYYTYPRVGLQFKRKFALYAVETCHDLFRIALKKGVHLRSEPMLEDAEFLCSGYVDDAIIKLDFTTSTESTKQHEFSAQTAEDVRIKAQQKLAEVTNIVVWTARGVDLITFERQAAFQGMTTEERKQIYAMTPLRSKGRLRLVGHSVADILVIHINANNVISLLCKDGRIHFYDFTSASHMFSVTVPGRLIAAGSENIKWKSREKFDFKGSPHIGTVIDSLGLVHVLVFATRKWHTIRARFLEKYVAESSGSDTFMLDSEESVPPPVRAPKPRFVRAAGHCVVFWNGLASASSLPVPPSDVPWSADVENSISSLGAGVLGGGPPPYYVEAWRCSNSAGGGFKPRKMICECYSSSSSVHIDEARMYVSASIERRDVFVDIWSLATGTFISRVHAVNNSWSLEKENMRTHLSKLFWSTNGTLLYYELNTRRDNSNSLCFRQLCSVPSDEYWVCGERGKRNARTLRSEAKTALYMDSSGNPSGKIHPFGYFWVFFMMSPTKSASK